MVVLLFFLHFFVKSKTKQSIDRLQASRQYGNSAVSATTTIPTTSLSTSATLSAPLTTRRSLSTSRTPSNTTTTTNNDHHHTTTLSLSSSPYNRNTGVNRNSRASSLASSGCVADDGDAAAVDALSSDKKDYKKLYEEACKEISNLKIDLRKKDEELSQMKLHKRTTLNSSSSYSGKNSFDSTSAISSSQNKYSKNTTNNADNLITLNKKIQELEEQLKVRHGRTTTWYSTFPLIYLSCFFVIVIVVVVFGFGFVCL